jgi:Domain of unknown function (DUF4062)
MGELATERQAVARAIRALRLTPVMFEAGARPNPPRELYQAYLAQSDVFVGIYWQRYGQVNAGMEVSGLEEEFLLPRTEGATAAAVCQNARARPRPPADGAAGPHQPGGVIPEVQHGGRAGSPGS